MVTFKLRLKRTLAACLHCSGYLRVLNALKKRNKSFVLMYHRVIESPESEHSFVQPGMYVAGDTFRMQLRLLKANFKLIHLSDLVQRLESKDDIGGYCAITFDDGWQDNFANAFPLLREYTIPATIFLATGFIGTRRSFWPEEFASLMVQSGAMKDKGNKGFLEKLLGKMPKHMDKIAFLNDTINNLKERTVHEREEILQQLRTLTNDIGLPRLLMNWEEAKKMQESGLIDFGAHTDQHVILDQVPIHLAKQEIEQSRKTLSDRLGVVPTLFAYPNGNHTNRLQDLLKETGFKAAVTTRKDWIKKSVSPFVIPRIGIHEDISQTIPLFLSRIHLRAY